MSEKFLNVAEVAKELDISKPYAYKLIHQLNEELQKLGYLTISGKVNRNYFNKKFCYKENERSDV